MRYAVIDDNGFVINVVVASEPLFNSWIPDEQEVSNIGMQYVGGEFTYPHVED